MNGIVLLPLDLFHPSLHRRCFLRICRESQQQSAVTWRGKQCIENAESHAVFSRNGGEPTKSRLIPR